MDYNGLQDASDTDDIREKRRVIVLGALFIAISALAGVDLVTDMSEGVSVTHFVLEGGAFAAGIVGLVFMAGAWRRLSAKSDALQVENAELGLALEATAEEANRWRGEARNLIEGLSAAIDSQFDRWELSDAEKEVAMLLLKGLSHKEIASIRDTTDATTRQQARAVYKKAGLSGRNDLSAFFLEDLLVPMTSKADETA